MNEIIKMRCGELADMSAPELQASFVHAKRILARLRGMSTYDEGYRELLEQLVPDLPSTSIICPPFHCDHGHGIRLGEHVFVNANCTFLDGAYITIGAHTLIGPDVKIYTPHHPMDFIKRRDSKEYAYPVTIGEDCWIGGGSIICPGVTIGNRCVIGAGSVVTKDIESDTVVAGNPAHIIKKSVTIRHTRISDLDTIMEIFYQAKQRMRESGNNSQWVNGYPNAVTVIKDIEEGNSFIIESDKDIYKDILGVFTFIVGDEPNYSSINGEWPDKEPYGTIHRIAAASGAKGVADIALDFCKTKGVNIRIDTHSDNTPMLGWIAKRGFKYCGIIRVDDGSPRRAYQLTLIQ